MFKIVDTESGTIIKILFKETYRREKDEEGFVLGWPETKIKPHIIIKGENQEPKKVFEGTEVDCTGCSMARRAAHVKIMKECFDWIVEYTIR